LHDIIGSAGAEEVPGQVNGNIISDVFIRQLGYGRDPSPSSGIVDQDVKASGIAHYFLKQPVPVGRPGRISRNAMNPEPIGGVFKCDSVPARDPYVDAVFLSTAAIPAPQPLEPPVMIATASFTLDCMAKTSPLLLTLLL
jgi:hypothetical protein